MKRAGREMIKEVRVVVTLRRVTLLVRQLSVSRPSDDNLL
jgi:hypothetical protein